MATLVTTDTDWIKLRTKDKADFIVDVDVAKCSRTIEQILIKKEEERRSGFLSSPAEDKDSDCIILPEIKGRVLGKVLEWCNKKYASLAAAAEAIVINGEYHNCPVTIEDWEREFLKANSGPILFDLVTAAKYLDIPGLVNLCCSDGSIEIRAPRTSRNSKKRFESA